MTSNPTIEVLWQSLRKADAEAVQRRVDATHPLDLYVEFEPPDRPGLVAVCGHRPAAMRPLRSVAIEAGLRGDGRWSLRLSLEEPRLFPVFAALCHDIVDFTRTGVTEDQLGAAIVGRLDHWRTLFERSASGLDDTTLRGLLGELCVLEEIIAVVGAAGAIAAWTGPFGTPQDFTLPDGRRIEVKAARRHARTVRINGLAQLDAGTDDLQLAVVRMEDTGRSAAGAITVPVMIERVVAGLVPDPEAVDGFRALLAMTGWHVHPRHEELVVRVESIDRYAVDGAFPKLTHATVPGGVRDASYVIELPAAPDQQSGAVA